MAFEVEPLAELEDLEARLEFELDDDQLIKVATTALVDASVLVRTYGVASWTKDTAPPIAVTLTLKAAARKVTNPQGLETGRGADETVMWGEYNAQGVYLRPDEIALLAEHRKVDSGFQAPRTYLYNSHELPPYRPVATGHYIPVDSYGEGLAKMWPDYMPGDEYSPLYPWRE